MKEKEEFLGDSYFLNDWKCNFLGRKVCSFFLLKGPPRTVQRLSKEKELRPLDKQALLKRRRTKRHGQGKHFHSTRYIFSFLLQETLFGLFNYNSWDYQVISKQKEVSQEYWRDRFLLWKEEDWPPCGRDIRLTLT